MAEGRLEGDGGARGGPEAAGIRGRDGHPHFALALARLLVAARRASTLQGAPQPRLQNTTLLASMSAEGMGPSLAVTGAVDARVFEAYLERVLLPELPPGRILVMDNLSAHKTEKARELVEARGCELVYLPPYSPDLNPTARRPSAR